MNAFIPHAAKALQIFLPDAQTMYCYNCLQASPSQCNISPRLEMKCRLLWGLPCKAQKRLECLCHDLGHGIWQQLCLE